MKNINLIRHLRTGVKKNSSLLARSKNDWDSGKLYFNEPQDEHVEPTKEDIVKEIFDKNYYPFGFKAKQSDEHWDRDMFDEYRQWQHLYVHPNEPFLGWTYGSAILKYLFFLMPLLTFYYFIKMFPSNNRVNNGRSAFRRYNTRL